MRKIILLIFMLFLLVGCGKNNNEIVMVTEAGFAPYEYYDSGQIVGVDIDIAKEIAKEMGKELVIKDVSFDSIINEVKTGKADFGAAGISYSEERAEEVDFSINYSVSKQIVIVKDNSSITNINDIGNKKIAVQLGSIADTYVTDNYKNADIIRQKKYLAAIEDLKSDKVDAVFSSLHFERIHLDDVYDGTPAEAVAKLQHEIATLKSSLLEILFLIWIWIW